MAGNRAVAQLLRRAIDQERPEGVDLGADALPTGSTVAHPEQARFQADKTGPGSGHVDRVDRILLDGLSGHQGGKSWGEGAKARHDHAAAAGTGKAGHRGRAVALVPQSMKRDGGPISVVVHLHGIDVGKYSGTSGMREQGERPEDVADFQIPQQLQAFSDKHPGARVVVLMPLGATVKAGAGLTVDFGLDDLDSYVDECLGQLGLSSAPASPDAAPGTVYLSAHSGGGFTISSLASRPFHKYRFGGVFGFESFHDPDIAAWRKLVTDHLDQDLAQLQALRAGRGKQPGSSEADVAAAQLSYLRDAGFRFAAFGGSTPGYASRVRSLRATILQWFKDRHAKLERATGGQSEILAALWRNYQANYAEEDHMAALAKDNHFESVLESLPAAGASAGAATAGGAGGAGARPVAVPKTPPSAEKTPPAAQKTPPPAPKTPPPAAKTRKARKPHTHTSHQKAPVDHQQGAKEEHRGEPPPPKAGARHQAPPEAQPEATTAPSSPRPFHLVKWDVYDQPIVVIPKETPHEKHKREVSATPSEFMLEILQNAHVKDAEHWFDHFVSGMTFLGQLIHPAIHQHLAEHLRQVEAELAEVYGGPDKDPKVAGQALGVTEDIKGSRAVSKTAAVSMHMFGLAVDVNYEHNPYLLASGAMPSDVFTRVGQLMKGEKLSYDVGMYKDLDAKYQQVTDFNDLVVQYFALAEDANLDELKHKQESATGKWKKMTAAAAQKQIKQDLAKLAGKLKRGKALIKTQGFLHMKKELVLGLKLNWGAWYGDMMHFDMRTDGDVGQHISEEIGNYLATLRRRADAPDPAPAKQ
jgi:hypothetical protein